MIKVTRFESDKLNLCLEKNEKGEWSVYSTSDKVLSFKTRDVVEELRALLSVIEGCILP